MSIALDTDVIDATNTVFGGCDDCAMRSACENANHAQMTRHNKNAPISTVARPATLDCSAMSVSISSSRQPRMTSANPLRTLARVPTGTLAHATCAFLAEVRAASASAAHPAGTLPTMELSVGFSTSMVAASREGVSLLLIHWPKVSIVAVVSIDMILDSK